MAVDIVSTYGLDPTGATDNSAKLATMFAQAVAMQTSGQPLPRGIWKEGIYAFSQWPTFNCPTGLQLVAEGEVYLKHTGTGDAVTFAGDFTSPLQGAWKVLFDGFTILPNANSHNGLVAHCCHQSTFRCEVRGAGAGYNAIYAPFCVLSEFEPMVGSNIANTLGPFNGASWNITGIAFDAYQGQQTTSSRIVRPNIGNVNIGIRFINSGFCAVIDGSSEYCNIGIQIDNGGNNHIRYLEMEGNKTNDIVFLGQAHDNYAFYCGPNLKVSDANPLNRNQVHPNWADTIGL